MIKYIKFSLLLLVGAFVGARTIKYTREEKRRNLEQIRAYQESVDKARKVKALNYRKRQTEKLFGDLENVRGGKL